MNRACHEFLARTAFAFEENSEWRIGCASDRLPDLLNRAADTDEIKRIVLSRRGALSLEPHVHERRANSCGGRGERLRPIDILWAVDSPSHGDRSDHTSEVMDRHSAFNPTARALRTEGLSDINRSTRHGFACRAG